MPQPRRMESRDKRDFSLRLTAPAESQSKVLHKNTHCRQRSGQSPIQQSEKPKGGNLPAVRAFGPYRY